MEDQLVLTFGDLVIGLDPWQVDYDGEVLTEPPAARPDEGVRLDVEVDGPWQPIVPAGDVVLPSPVAFVDGIRRMEARLVVQRPGGIAHGVFAKSQLDMAEPGTKVSVSYETKGGEKVATDVEWESGGR